MAESIQKKLTRVRPPRVRITYDVEIGDALVKKELPFVLGIMADLSGTHAVDRLAPYKERQFAYIDKDNFDAVLHDAQPQLELTGTAAVQLRFESLADFTPSKIVKQVEPLRNLFYARNRLQDLASKIDGSDPLHESVFGLLAVPEADRTAITAALEERRTALLAKIRQLESSLEHDSAFDFETDLPGVTAKMAAQNKKPGSEMTQEDIKNKGKKTTSKEQAQEQGGEV